jgi:hypothetical protein
MRIDHTFSALRLVVYTKLDACVDCVGGFYNDEFVNQNFSIDTKVYQHFIVSIIEATKLPFFDC